MADNITLLPGGGGDTLATDDIGGIHYQIIKLAYGALDSVTIVTGTAGLPVASVKPATGTRSSVAGAAADTLILAANASRLGATIYNDSTATLYLGLGTTAASTSNYTVQIFSNGYYEVPADFTGQIRGIWGSATGNARVTELT